MILYCNILFPLNVQVCWHWLLEHDSYSTCCCQKKPLLHVYGQLLNKLVESYVYKYMYHNLYLFSFCSITRCQMLQVSVLPKLLQKKSIRWEKERGLEAPVLEVYWWFHHYKSNEKINQNSVTIWIINSNLYTCIK